MYFPPTYRRFCLGLRVAAIPNSGYSQIDECHIFLDATDINGSCWVAPAPSWRAESIVGRKAGTTRVEISLRSRTTLKA